MIKPNELRIGNLVTDEEGIRIFKVFELSMDSQATHKVLSWDINNTGRGISDDRTHPIPITEEWLIRFGFEKYADWSWSQTEKEDVWFCLQETTESSNQELREFQLSNIKNHLLSRCINYVHQLQNLFYEITGEELELKQEINEGE